MNKLVTKIIGLALGLTLAASVGVVAFVSSNNESSDIAQATAQQVKFTASSDWNNKESTIDVVTLSFTNGQIADNQIQVNKGSKIEVKVPKATDVYYINKIIFKSVAGYTAEASFPNNTKGMTYTHSGTIGTFLPEKTGEISSNVSFTAKNAAVYFTSIEVTYSQSTDKTLSSIGIGGSLAVDTYGLNENWDVTGLTVTANYSDHTTADVTSSVQWTFSPETANDSSIRTLEITATYFENKVMKTASIEEEVSVIYDEATGYARAFTRALSTICDSNGDTDLTALTSAWSDLSFQYGELSNSSKQTLQNVSSSGIDDKAKAVALYDYIVGKYSQLANFMSRSVNNSNVMGREINTSHADMSLAVIVVITLTITSLGAYFFLHKKKHN